MALLVVPYNKTPFLPQNALMFFNDISLMTLPNNVTPGVYDIAYYISSFKVVVLSQMTGGPLNNQIRILQLAKQFSPNMQVYIRVDGNTILDQDSTQVNGTPLTQIKSAIDDIVLIYNSSNISVDGIYIDAFDFPNVGYGADPALSPTKSGLSFRDIQLYTMSYLKKNNLLMAFSCVDYQYATNLNFILNYTWNPVGNPQISFNETDTLIYLDLYGSNFYVSGGFSTGYANQPDFMYNMLLLNSIRVDRRNLGLKLCLCVTAADSNSFTSNTFFTSAAPLGVKAVGIAQAVYRLATWIAADYICASAYPDFYLSETSASPLFVKTFDYDQTYGDYNALGRIEAVSNKTLGYEINPTISVTVEGQNTGSMNFDKSTYPIIVP